MRKIQHFPYIKNILLSLLLFFTSNSCSPSRYRYQEPDAPLCPIPVPKQIRVALVLGSGGVRGMAHVGVIEELELAGIPIDLIIGSSAGSLVGAIYSDNPCIEHTKRALSHLRSNSLLDFDIWNCRYGLCQARAMQHVIDYHLEAETFEELKIPLVIMTTDLCSGEAVPIGSGDLVTAIKASCSIPFLFVPCQHMGRVLVDGGVANPVPVKVAKDLGAEIVIAVDLCELLPPTFPSNLFQIAIRSVEIITMWQNEVCSKDADVLIRPRTCEVGSFNDKMKWKLYYAGREATREHIPHIKKLLSELPCEEGGRELHFAELKCYTPQIYFLDPDEEEDEEEKEQEEDILK